MLAVRAGTEEAPGQAACVISWVSPHTGDATGASADKEKTKLPTSLLTSSEILWDVEVAEQQPELHDVVFFCSQPKPMLPILEKSNKKPELFANPH